MAGGRRKMKNRMNIGRRNERSSSRDMFVVGGGELADWSNPSSTSGRKLKGKDNMVKRKRVDTSEAKSSGSQRRLKKDQKDVARYSHYGDWVQRGVSSDLCCLREDNVSDIYSPIALADSGKTAIVAYMDDAPSESTVELKYTYAYTSGLVLDEECDGGLDGSEQQSLNGTMVESQHLGLLYETRMSEVAECSASDMPYQVENSGFLSIGGMKLYAQDLSDQDDGYENISDGVESNHTESLSDSDDSGSDDSDSDYSEYGFSMDSDLEEDIAEDYLEGIGGLQEVINVDQLFVNAYDEDSYNSRSYSKSSRKKGPANNLRTSHFHAPRSKLMKRCAASRNQGITMPSKSMKFVEEALGSDNGNLRIKSSKVLKGRWVGSRESTKENGPKRSKIGKRNMISMSQPVSFVSRGILDWEITEIEETNKASVISNEVTSTSYGAFEVHTTGFGSRMMAKMGFSGGGLGKDGQGMAEPIEVMKRPKSLGLGVQFTDADLSKSRISKNEIVTVSEPVQTTQEHPKAQGSSSKSVIRPKTKGSSTKSIIHCKSKRSSKRVFRPKTEGSSSRSIVSHKAKSSSESIISTAYPSQSGAFEKHTRGFGSKMMSKMGFMEGTGLESNLQGIVNPLAAVRRPKSLGLGADH